MQPLLTAGSPCKMNIVSAPTIGITNTAPSERRPKEIASSAKQDPKLKRKAIAARDNGTNLRKNQTGEVAKNIVGVQVGIVGAALAGIFTLPHDSVSDQESGLYNSIFHSPFMLAPKFLLSFTPSILLKSTVPRGIRARH
mmetsp:Transcript_16343/g.44953  ORF Transcript_16343/g.44953 Transcript_16343/m.44953 type:complete len:140 (-) Transcript_16343:467-886(-)